MKDFDGDAKADSEKTTAPATFDALIETPVRTNELWQGKIFKVIESDVELQDGTLGLRQMVMHPGGAGVVCVIDRKICLVKQYRLALKAQTLELPAGRSEAGESRDKTAARELKEETGLVALEMERLAVSYGSPGWTNECTEIYWAKRVEAGTQNLDAHEFVNVEWVDIDQAAAMIETGAICDSKTIIGIQAWLLRAARA